MNMLRNIFFCLMTGALALLVSCSNSSSEKLPSSAETFISKHFGDSVEIASVERNADLDYEVVLSNDIELRFERHGVWEEINVKRNIFPSSVLNVLPQNVSEYITKNYPEKRIRKIENKRYGYFVRLNKPNAIELKFSKAGVLLEDEELEDVGKVNKENGQLPSAANLFIKKHFGDSVEIYSVLQNMDLDYEVMLADGTELCFDRHGEWEELDAKTDNLPKSIKALLPKNTIAYISKNYPEKKIRKIEIKRYGYRIRLSKPSAIELKFAKNGSLVQVIDESKN